MFALAHIINCQLIKQKRTSHYALQHTWDRYGLNWEITLTLHVTLESFSSKLGNSIKKFENVVLHLLIYNCGENCWNLFCYIARGNCSFMFSKLYDYSDNIFGKGLYSSTLHLHLLEAIRTVVDKRLSRRNCRQFCRLSWSEKCNTAVLIMF